MAIYRVQASCLSAGSDIMKLRVSLMSLLFAGFDRKQVFQEIAARRLLWLLGSTLFTCFERNRSLQRRLYQVRGNLQQKFSLSPFPLSLLLQEV